jgi:hypothetical protein
MCWVETNSYTYQGYISLTPVDVGPDKRSSLPLIPLQLISMWGYGRGAALLPSIFGNNGESNVGKRKRLVINTHKEIRFPKMTGTAQCRKN